MYNNSGSQHFSGKPDHWSQYQFLTEWSRSTCKHSSALITVGQRCDPADRYLTTMLPAFEMLEYSASYLHISWFGKVRILVNRYTELAQAAIDPSFLFEQLEYSESRRKWSFLHMFTYICNAERLLIPLVPFSLFLSLLDSDILSCEGTKAGNVTQANMFFHIPHFSQRRKKY